MRGTEESQVVSNYFSADLAQIELADESESIIPARPYFISAGSDFAFHVAWPPLGADVFIGRTAWERVSASENFPPQVRGKHPAISDRNSKKQSTRDKRTRDTSPSRITETRRVPDNGPFEKVAVERNLTK